MDPFGGPSGQEDVLLAGEVVLQDGKKKKRRKSHLNSQKFTKQLAALLFSSLTLFLLFKQTAEQIIETSKYKLITY